MEDSDINDNASIEIMNYLIKKLESTYNSILKFNNLIDSYDTSEEFFSLRKDLKLLFTDLTENLNQGIFAIKALTNQNKKLKTEIENKEENFGIKENIKDNNINIEKNEQIYENNNNINIINKEEDNINIRQKNNKFELQQLANVKNIMDNMKRNKLKVKMIIGQHFSNNQEIQDSNN